MVGYADRNFLQNFCGKAQISGGGGGAQDAEGCAWADGVGSARGPSELPVTAKSVSSGMVLSPFAFGPVVHLPL
jgi:hypothetical protein